MGRVGRERFLSFILAFSSLMLVLCIGEENCMIFISERVVLSFLAESKTLCCLLRNF